MPLEAKFAARRGLRQSGGWHSSLVGRGGWRTQNEGRGGWTVPISLDLTVSLGPIGSARSEGRLDCLSEGSRAGVEGLLASHDVSYPSDSTSAPTEDESN